MSTGIKTTKTIYPQIYAYTLPDTPKRDGWVKIGYTERFDVDQRIKEQTQTAAISLDYSKIWSEPAQFANSEEWFKDKQLHSYLRKNKGIEQDFPHEWFFYPADPNQSLHDFHDFVNGKFEQSSRTEEYTLRPEQDEAVTITADYARNTSDGEFLWNAKPRFGKTLATYDLARKLDASLVLIVTNRPAIANSWFDDFEKFVAWQTDYAFISTSDSLKERPVMTREQFVNQMADGRKHQIAFVSLQDLKGSAYFGGDYDKLKWIKELKWDMLVLDEAHEGIDTFKTDIAFDNIKRAFTLHLSGTPFKAVASGKFGDNEIYNWTYEDEQLAKSTWVEEAFNPYSSLPKLNLFSYEMSQMITEEVSRGSQVNGKNVDYAFDLNEFFETKEDGSFTHLSDVKSWIDSLSSNHKYPFSTDELRNELKHTFWLLDRVDSAKALKRLLEKHDAFKSYKIVLAAGDGRIDDEAVVDKQALDRVRSAISTNDKTITLSVGQLATGITIPEWTGVLMLSNLKSPARYMQAAFRAQSPWKYVVDGETRQKQNAYVFDFSPERTLIIYEEFANNLSSGTTNGNGTSEQRKSNVKELLNFFPVIAEDDEGRMVELNAEQVLTIPKSIKAREVVRQGFMSNLLFQNISGIFASQEAKEILNLLNPADNGKKTTKKTSVEINTNNVEVDDDGNAVVSKSIISEQVDARFGEKIYGSVGDAIDSTDADDDSLSKVVESAFKEHFQQDLEDVASESGVTKGAANTIVDNSAKAVGRIVETEQKSASIKQKEAQIEYERKVAEAQDSEAKARADEEFRQNQNKIKEELNSSISDKVKEASKEQAETATKNILENAENKKKRTVEDDVRSRLRGFSRTIPSFLMAYGNTGTTLGDFDTSISDNVFREVTGITLDQFRTLRDEYDFFDEVVFNESVQEFIKKKEALSNYFDDAQEEDIFDYIPPQKTNQIFTPKKVVKMMVDKMEEEDPMLFRDPDKTFADLYMKSGLFIAEIVKRLHKGLELAIPDPDIRLKHILENQVYGFAPSEIIHNIARNFIFGFDENAGNIDRSHIVHLDTTPYAKREKDFEVICAQLFGENGK
jgi:type II restriction enzyme